MDCVVYRMHPLVTFMFNVLTYTVLHGIETRLGARTLHTPEF